MIRSEKKLKELAAVLGRQNSILVAEAINMLRDEPPFEGAIGLLTSYYDSTTNSSVRKAIECFMDDIKDQSACNEVMTEVRKGWKYETLTMLIASCWQSGLDYSGFMTDFVRIFNNSDYMTSVECFTLIETSLHLLSQDNKTELINLVSGGVVSESEEKQALAKELLRVLGE
jgi:predicted DNA-binding protein